MDTFDKVMFGGVLSFVAVLLFGVCYLIYDEVMSDKFYLRKDQWRCSAAHEETYVTYQKVGDVDVPVVNTSVVCDQWSRR
jgi:hypothetical protein